MGITGLLPFVKSACRQGNIRELRSKSVAVDVSCLLHRGLTGCMDKIHMGEETNGYIKYVERYIRELLMLQCHVVMVFDGRPLPAKKQTNDDRREQRDKNMQHAEYLLAKGMEKEARDKYRLATKISSDIVESTIENFRSWENIDIVVAPYEADAQLAYLMKAKLVDAVITEDSDLIVFGCEKIYFKWQAGNGECSVYEQMNLKKCFTGEMSGEKFDFMKFRRICILAGCDYLQQGLPGVGLSTATKFFLKTSITDLKMVLKKIPAYLNNPKLKTHINSEFIQNFIRAENTFLHQIVFDPKERCQRRLHPYPMIQDDDIIDLEDEKVVSSSQNFEYAGKIATQKIATRLALGNPATGAAIEDKFLTRSQDPGWSVWSEKYVSKGMVLEKEEKLKDEKAQNCGGGAFKLDAPSVVKKVKKLKKLDDDLDDDIVKQFMEDVDKETEIIIGKKRKNAPNSDYSAEEMLNKYKKQKVEETCTEVLKIDDFDEIFEEKIEKSVGIVEEKDVLEDDDVLKPPPLIRKVVSSPAAVNAPKNLKKFQSPVLATHNSTPIPVEKTTKTLGQSKYFKEKSENSPRVSNPFKCPAFVKPKPVEAVVEEKIEEKATILSKIDEDTAHVPNFRYVGFKNTGLSRKRAAK